MVFSEVPIDNNQIASLIDNCSKIFLIAIQQLFSKDYHLSISFVVEQDKARYRSPEMKRTSLQLAKWLVTLLVSMIVHNFYTSVND